MVAPSAPAESPGAAARRAEDRRTAQLLAVIFLAALTLRLVHLRAVLPVVLDQPTSVGLDRWLNTNIAAAVARGDWAGGWAAAYDSSPGYSYVLAGLYALCGRRWIGPLMIQAVLGAVTSLLLFVVGRRLHGETVGLLAAILGALCTPAIFYEGLLVKFSLVPFAVAAVLVATLRVRASPTAGRAILAGLSLGLLLLLRPNMAVVASVVLLWPVVRRPWSVVLPAIMVTMLGAVAVLGSMAVRDRLAERRGLGGSLWGIHFYIGTNPHADGEYVDVPGVRADAVGHVTDARQVAERHVGRALTPAEVSRYWFRRGVAFVRAHPGRYLALEMRKVWLAFEAGESGSFGDEFDEFRKASPVLSLPLVSFAVIGPLGLLGLACSLRRREAALLPLFVAAIVASLLPFFIAGRYRLPLVPPMTILAALALVRIEQWSRGRRRSGLAVAAAAASALAVALGAGDVQTLALLAALGLGVTVAAELGPPGSSVPHSLT